MGLHITALVRSPISTARNISGGPAQDVGLIGAIWLGSGTFFIFLPHYFLAVTVSRGGEKHFALLFRSGNSDLAELQSAKNRTPQISRRCLAFSVFRSSALLRA